MMLLKSVVPLAVALASTALADVKTISDSLKTITKDLVALDGTINKFDGQIFSALPIIGASSKLEGSLKSGAATANESTPLSYDDTLVIANLVGVLAGDAKKTVDDLIAQKPKFDKLFIVSPIVLSTSKKLRAATANFSEAVIGKVPPELKAVGGNLVKGIDDDFARAVKAYSGGGAALPFTA
ncbi:hypothetical protein EsDP_00005359 [Epichloe bromicola]|uniref:Antigenic cell wall galactomannoprotein n=1 Tax=Epichloe bromicola TaxID=79588 RepID=A0ABQ0CUE7_9HYPO